MEQHPWTVYPSLPQWNRLKKTKKTKTSPPPAVLLLFEIMVGLFFNTSSGHCYQPPCSKLVLLWKAPESSGLTPPQEGPGPTPRSDARGDNYPQLLFLTKQLLFTLLISAPTQGFTPTHTFKSGCEEWNNLRGRDLGSTEKERGERHFQIHKYM